MQIHKPKMHQLFPLAWFFWCCSVCSCRVCFLCPKFGPTSAAPRPLALRGATPHDTIAAAASGLSHLPTTESCRTNTAACFKQGSCPEELCPCARHCRNKLCLLDGCTTTQIARRSGLGTQPCAVPQTPSRSRKLSPWRHLSHCPAPGSRLAAARAPSLSGRSAAVSVGAAPGCSCTFRSTGSRLEF